MFWLTMHIFQIIWGIFLFGGFAVGRLNESQTHRTSVRARMLSSLTLAAAGWFFYWAFWRASEVESIGLLVATGMTLGFIGDLFMAQFLPLKNDVMNGIASFSLGHIAYIVAFFRIAALTGLEDPASRWGSLIVWLLIGAAGWYLVVFRNQKPTPLHSAALPYALLLATTAGFATGLALQSSVFIPLAIGAALFLLSDLLLAAQLFNNLHFKLIGDVVWFLYGPAQMLIVLYSTSAAALQFISLT